MSKRFLFNHNLRKAGRRRRVRKSLRARVERPFRHDPGFLRFSAEDAGKPPPHFANAHDRTPSSAFDRAALS
jgi:hypothetical protein